MRLVLVDNLLLDRADVSTLDLQPHLGLISLIAVAREAGHEAVLYDPKLDVHSGALDLKPSLYREMADQVLAREPQVAGFTALGCNFICTAKVAAYLKQSRPDLPVLLGGPHATILAHQILRSFPQFDVVVGGEAEPNLVPLLDALGGGQKLSQVTGVTFGDRRSLSGVRATDAAEPVADLDALPFPAYDAYPIDALGLTSLRVDAGRGCPFRCTFCSTATFFGRRYRLKSPERLVSELDVLAGSYGVTDFNLNHDMFTAHKGKVRACCEVLAGRGYTWRCSARMDCVDEDLLRDMHGAGCRSMYFGVETGSARLQKLVQKNLDLSLVQPTLRTAHGLGIEPTVSYITGYPQEEQEDQAQTLDGLGDCLRQDPDGIHVQLHLLTPEPGTAMLDELASTLRYDGHVSDFNFPTLESDDGDVMRANPEVFVNHHYYDAALPRERHIFVTEMVERLRALGSLFFAYLITHFEGRLSLLIDALDDLHKAHPQPPSGALVVECVAERYGWGHHLTSMARYAHAAESLRREVAPGLGGEPAAVLPPGAELVLSESAVLLDDLHDCAWLARRIREQGTSGPPLDDATTGHRGTYLLVRQDEGQGEVTAFQPDDTTATLLRLHQRPRKVGALVDALGVRGVEPEGLTSALGELVGTGLLRRA